ncbi:MAG: hypothetical protein HUU43_16175 [Ignavibacteriaceae bacterium]|nr:hypothetical protein [Ignavibacteriaceae bacterium]
MSRPGILDELLKRQNELSALTGIESNTRTAAKKLSEFILFLSENNQSDFISANFAEFDSIFQRIIENYPVAGADPQETALIISAAEKLIVVKKHSEREKISAALIRLSSDLEFLKDKLYGRYRPDHGYLPDYQKILFPILEKGKLAGEGCFLESVNVTLTPSVNKNEFFILSRYNDNDEILISQIKESFEFSYRLSKVSSKLKKECYFNVYVKFTGDYGWYTGKSFGAALSLAFLIEIEKFFNPDIEFRLLNSLALTGEISSTGELKRTGNENIRYKTEGIFYSEADVFICPAEDFSAAKSHLRGLKGKFPERNLVILPVSNISEILHRRDVIEIKKKSLFNRSARFLQKHLFLILVTLLLLTVSSLYFYSAYDDNPSGYKVNGFKFHILNKSGRVLWSGEQTVDLDYELKFTNLDRIIRIFDSDNDGVNEVLIAQMKSDKSAGIYAERGAVLFNKKGEVIWQFQFSDSVYSLREGYMEKVYGSDIMDIADQDGKKIVYLVNNNAPSFTSAIIRIDAATGRRIPGTLWNPGHIIKGRVFSSSEGIKLIALAHDNGYEKITAFVVPAEIKDGMIITTEAYRLRGVNPVLPEIYLRFPINDYEQYRKYKQPFFLYSRYAERGENVFDINTRNPENPGQGFLLFWLNAVTGEVSVFVDSAFRYIRDSLVSAGILNPPLTDTKEYTDAIRDSIDYYFDGKWIKYQDYHRLRKEGKLKP